MKRARSLSAQERALWETVARQIEPLDDIYLNKLPKSVSVKALSMEIINPAPVRKFQIGEKSSGSSIKTRGFLNPSLSQSLAAQPIKMDSKNFTQMKRGKIKPEGRIDLHGMTLEQAHPELVDFIQSAHARGKRLVLVITGKGKMRDEGGPIPRRYGVLRHQVPQWLALAPLAVLVLQTAEAHANHGGYGALYVYLRRSR